MCVFVMNATTGPFRVDVLYVVEGSNLGCLPTCKACSVLSKRKTQGYMVVWRLLIWGVLERTCFISARNMVLRKDDENWIDICVLLLN